MTNGASTAVGAIVSAVRDSVAAPPSAEAIEAVDELLPEGDAFVDYVGRFMMLILLSAGIAPPACWRIRRRVIGAMLVAPLMTPTLLRRDGDGPQRLTRACLADCAGIASTAPPRLRCEELMNNAELPGEVLARTFPG
jgi:hypothetical protein